MIGIAKIFKSIQGEGLLLGLPMVFIRTAGCSVGCPGCDTNYQLAKRMSVSEIVGKCVEIGLGCQWAWVTGGEPTDWPEVSWLSEQLNKAGFSRAIATAGTRELNRNDWDFISVSPHSLSNWRQRSGDQLNLVPGLGGLSEEDIHNVLGGDMANEFSSLWVTPLHGSGEKFDVSQYPGVRLGVQAHKVWGFE